MGFFTIGNILTIGIVILILIVFRSMDKRGRIMDQVRKYGDKLKNDLSAFVEEREGAVKNFGIELKVEQEAARELMKRIQASVDDLESKAATADRIDERLNNYDASMEELMRMTGRVQENLSRIRDESAFVDGANRRITEAKAALEGLEYNLESLQIRFEQDNTEALEKISVELMAEIKSAVSDLRAQAETIERRVEDHRDAVNKIEREREAALNRDMEMVEGALNNMVEQAALRADRMEEAALQKIKEQAQDRLERLRNSEEEKILAYQENARHRIAEIQDSLKNIQEVWQVERHDWEASEKTYQAEYENAIRELKKLAAEAENQLDMGKKTIDQRLAELKIQIA